MEEAKEPNISTVLEEPSGLKSVEIDNNEDNRSSSDEDIGSSYGSILGSRGNGTGQDDDHCGADRGKGLLETKVENQVVLGSKFLVYLVLLMAAAAVGSICFVLLSKEDDNDFRTEFRALALDIMDVAESNAFDTASVLKSMSLALSSYVEDSGQVNGTHRLPDGEGKLAWPFVTEPNFDKITSESLRLSGAEVVAMFIYVRGRDKDAFEEYAQNNQEWIRQGLDYAKITNPDGTPLEPGSIPRKMVVPRIPNDVALEESDLIAPRTDPFYGGDTLHLPVWQLAPAPTDASVVLQDMRRSLWFQLFLDNLNKANGYQVSEMRDMRFLTSMSASGTTYMPQSMLVQPIFGAITDPDWKDVRTGFLVAVLNWGSFFENLLPPRRKGFIVVVDDGCTNIITFEINGREARYVGLGDLHDPSYNDLKEFRQFDWHDPSNEDAYGECRYQVSVYPSSALEDTYKTDDPYLYSAVVVFVFLFTGLFFFVYDWMVQRRQASVLSSAQRTTAIVASLFPKNVQERLLREAETGEEENNKEGRGLSAPSYFLSNKNVAAKNQLKNFLIEDEAKATNTLETGSSDGKSSFLHTKPIADLFPETTVLFADLVGFTAWSSMREPSQVFTLLETIYHAFDKIARRRRVFKVETVGDCYVAVTGLPEPQKDHAVLMARFSRDCLSCLRRLTQELEEVLGPDTGDLDLRLGMHSGPVTAGVLRGEKARFQLFGDTMNTASRMESTSIPGKIHLSQETADLLKAAGKGSWCSQRPDKVFAKGKGELVTYWLELTSDMSGTASVVSSNTNDTMGVTYDQMGRPTIVPSEVHQIEAQFEETTEVTAHQVVEEKQQENVAMVLSAKPSLNEKHSRLVNWNCEVLTGLLKEIATRRKWSGVKPDSSERLRKLEKEKLSNDANVLDEVKDIITLPRFAETKLTKKEAAVMTLDGKVVQELHDFVEAVAALYRDNPFHGFEHASHVTMSVVKLLARIVAPDLTQQQLNEQTLHDHTYGITSDPLTQFVCIFAALIHDLDHPGVPNSQLVKEGSSLALAYKGKSVAEQNSVDLAWDLLMDSRFVNLREAIYSTESEFKRFRQLLVNTVMATDVMDKDLGAVRKARWNKAFAEGTKTDDDDEEAVNRKATIVLEHLIQASDVAHTMQHWQIYRKWNSRLFNEMYLAYKAGRAEKDPAEFWYKGEIGFFDFYVIPLAKKLKDCGVFGVSSDEYLIYAQKNRREWENKGQEVVAELIEARRKDNSSECERVRMPRLENNGQEVEAKFIEARKNES